MCSPSPPRSSYKCPADPKWSSNNPIVTVFSKHLQPTRCACVHPAESQREERQLLPAFLLQLVYIPGLFKASIYIFNFGYLFTSWGDLASSSAGAKRVHCPGRGTVTLLSARQRGDLGAFPSLTRGPPALPVTPCWFLPFLWYILSILCTYICSIVVYCCSLASIFS